MSFVDVLRNVVGDQDVAPKRHQPPKTYVQEVQDESNDDDETEFVTFIRAEDIRPDITAANSMSVALQEMSTCKGMFDKWADELDR